MGVSLISIVGPVAGGLIAGLLHTVLSPDHLATIITLSACQGTKAFWFGIQWGLGHLGGMAIIGTIFTLLRAGTDFEAYEHYMDYMVGFVLVGMGIHFLCRSDKYFDAEWAPKQASCACHAHLVPGASEKDPILPRHGHSHSHGHSHGNSDSHCHEDPHGKDCKDKFPHHSEHLRSWGAALVGFLQGLACPAGVVGIVFLKAYQPGQIAAFIVIFFVTATLAMGTLAMAYGVLTQRCVRSATVARYIYYGSCTMSIVLGVAWLALNASGSLEGVLGHHHDHGGHDHSIMHRHDHEHAMIGEQHEHEHHHQHNLMMAALSLMA
jgi:ABC-type nickel/cobalt efflux system permease component RcnA